MLRWLLDLLAVVVEPKQWGAPILADAFLLAILMWIGCVEARGRCWICCCWLDAICAVSCRPGYLCRSYYRWGWSRRELIFLPDALVHDRDDVQAECYCDRVWTDGGSGSSSWWAGLTSTSPLPLDAAR
ncbi:hypothetical protein Nepgr_006768 [Nepenthes gracilis]|uniref:Uncharacterized protein n=1 Tax=Nepenthes gracilis TaxID=150966 RepID=A0AAD3S5R8_NEPGR|nr:hypothetical protein Nepgr_006768 [Nepenthes gracilis]